MARARITQESKHGHSMCHRCVVIGFFIFYLCLIQYPLSGQDRGGIVLAVAEFKTIRVPTDLGSMAAEVLRTEIIGSPEFQVVERDQLRKIVEELKLNISGLVADNSIRIGQISPVTHLVLGSLVKIGRTYSLSIRCVSTESGLSLMGQVEKFFNEEDLYTVCSNIATKMKKKLVMPYFSASSEKSGYEAEKAFDGKGSTSWIAADETFEGWLQVEFPYKKEINHVGFYCRDRWSGEGIPKHFVIEVFHVDKWVKIAEEKSNRRVEWYRNLPPVMGRRFRIRVFSVISTRQSLQIAEIKFLLNGV